MGDDTIRSPIGVHLEVTFDDRFSGGSFRATKHPGITWDTWVVVAEEAGVGSKKIHGKW